jgi:chromosome segregation ATPase
MADDILAAVNDLKTRVAVLEERFNSMSSSMERNEIRTTELTTEANAISKGIEKLSGKLDSYSELQTTEKKYLTETIEGIKEKIEGLIEKSKACTQLQIDVSLLRVLVKKLEDFKADYYVEIKKIKETKENKCDHCIEEFTKAVSKMTPYFDIVDTLVEEVKAISDDSNRRKYGTKGVLTLLTTLALILGLVVSGLTVLKLSSQLKVIVSDAQELHAQNNYNKGAAPSALPKPQGK